MINEFLIKNKIFSVLIIIRLAFKGILLIKKVDAIIGQVLSLKLGIGYFCKITCTHIKIAMDKSMCTLIVMLGL